MPATKNAHAIQAYLTAQAEAQALIVQLTAQMQHHQDAYAPETIHWGHVGDIQAIIDQLRSIVTGEDDGDRG